MQLEIYRSAWGLVGDGLDYPTLEAFLASTHEESYVGVEFPLFLMNSEKAGRAATEEMLSDTLRQTGMKYMPLFATWPENFADFKQHLQGYREQCEQAQKLGVSKAVVHAGGDWMGVEKGAEFLSEAMKIAADNGIQPCFETHRARILYNPFSTMALLEKLPELELTTDLSHWLVVLDRWPHDQLDLFEYASTRAAHFHGRIGHEKAPQVTEPSDPIWQKHVELFKSWWQITVNTARENNKPLSATPEFGPFPYMHHEPFTHEPSADLAKVNRWMREQLDTWFN